MAYRTYHHLNGNLTLTLDNRDNIGQDQGHFRDYITVNSRISYLLSVSLLIPLLSISFYTFVDFYVFGYTYYDFSTYVLCLGHPLYASNTCFKKGIFVIFNNE